MKTASKTSLFHRAVASRHGKISDKGFKKSSNFPLTKPKESVTIEPSTTGVFIMVVFETTIGHTIQLQQVTADNFCVIYGKQVSTGLTYSQAAEELGECIMHALACEGLLSLES